MKVFDRIPRVEIEKYNLIRRPDIADFEVYYDGDTIYLCKDRGSEIEVYAFNRCNKQKENTKKD